MSISGFRYLTKQGMGNIARNKLMSFASIGVLTACLVITGIAALMSLNVGKFVDYLGAQNKVIVYLKLDADDTTIESAKQAIGGVSNILGSTYVSKEDALNETKSWISGYDDGAYANVLDGYEGENNPLYASFRVTVDDLSKIKDTVEELSKLPGVDFVDAPSDLAGTLVSLKRAVNIGGWGLVSVLAAVSLVVIHNTIRITVFARRKEINIMKFVGATNGFIRLPFLVEGTAIGLISAVLAFGVVSGAYIGILEAVAHAGTGWLSSLYFTIVDDNSVWSLLLVAFLASGALIGGVGSAASIRRHLKV